MTGWIVAGVLAVLLIAAIGGIFYILSQLPNPMGH
jgi:hypothetical protein